MPHVVLKWDAESDGDPSHKPTAATVHRPADPEHEFLYRHKLAQQLMVESGRAEKGKEYVLDRLPQGYMLWERARPSNPKHIDRYLYGHPKHLFFDSPNTFFLHLKWLSDGQEGACHCVRCGKQVKSTSRLPNTTSMSRGKAISIRPRPGRPFSKALVDEEGVPYTVPLFLSLLHKEGKAERTIQENLSMDWCVENIVDRETRERLSLQSSFVPRVGEIVLWYWSIDGELRREPATGQLKVWDGKAFQGHPVWRGGIVTQAPIADEPVRLDDITHKTPKKHNVNSSGFRVECYPDPDDEDKAFSKQYTYVPMNHIRPMSFFLDITNGIPDVEWHPTISNVMKAMSCVSCIDRHKLKGTWPDFHMYYRGMYFGAECHWIDEPIRLVPRQEDGRERITEVMIPKTIVVRTYNVMRDTSDIITGTNADRIELVLQGHIYTTELECSQGQRAFIPISSILHSYGPWYHLEGSKNNHEIQYQHTAGRLYEYEAMRRWYPGIQPDAALDAGFGGISFTRNYAVHRRIQQGDHKAGYFWGDHRAEALDLATFNGIDVGVHDMDRDPQKWRQVLALLDREKTIPAGLARVPKVVIPVARVAGFAPSTIQPVGAGKQKEVIELDSSSESEPDADVDQTIEGLISGEGFGEEVTVDDGEGGRSSKRARMQ